MNLRKILIVDDSPMMFSMLKIILMGYQDNGTVLLYAENGAAAIPLVKKEIDIDLIFLDLNMPVMDGMQFLEHAKANLAISRIPIIITSSQGDPASIERAIQAGARGYLKKPFQKDDCYEMIAKIFKNRRTRLSE